MAPSAIEVDSVNTKSKYPAPLQLSGALKDYEHFEVTPSIGREYPKANLADLLSAPNSDDLIRDLAITSTYNSHIDNKESNVRAC